MFREEEVLPVLINLGLIVVGTPIASWLFGAMDPTCKVSSYQPQLLHIMFLLAIQPTIFMLSRALRNLSVRKSGDTP